MAPGLTYRDDFSGPQDRAAVHRLLRDVFDVDVSPLEEMDLWDPTYRTFSYLDEAGCCVANAATFTLPLIVIGDVRTDAELSLLLDQLDAEKIRNARATQGGTGIRQSPANC